MINLVIWANIHSSTFTVKAFTQFGLKSLKLDFGIFPTLIFSPPIESDCMLLLNTCIEALKPSISPVTGKLRGEKLLKHISNRGERTQLTSQISFTILTKSIFWTYLHWRELNEL